MIQLYIYTYVFFFKFFSIMVHHRILNIVPCAIQQLFVYMCVYVNPELLIYLFPPFPFGNHKFVFFVCESVSVL